MRPSDIRGRAPDGSRGGRLAISYMPPHCCGFTCCARTRRHSAAAACRAQAARKFRRRSSCDASRDIHSATSFPVGIRRGANFADMRGTVIVPAVLVPAHELQADGFAGELRENRGGLRDIVVAAVAVGAGTFVILHANLLGWQTENGSNGIPRGVNILGGGDHERGIRFHVRERAIGAEGSVSLIGRMVGARGQCAERMKTPWLRLRVRELLDPWSSPRAWLRRARRRCRAE